MAYPDLKHTVGLPRTTSDWVSGCSSGLVKLFFLLLGTPEVWQSKPKLSSSLESIKVRECEMNMASQNRNKLGEHPVLAQKSLTFSWGLIYLCEIPGLGNALASNHLFYFLKNAFTLLEFLFFNSTNKILNGNISYLKIIC